MPTGPQFEWVDQRGQSFSSDTYPVHAGPAITVESGGGGVLPLLPFLGGSGPHFRAFGPVRSGRCSGFSQARGIQCGGTSPPASETTTYIVGAPELTFTYSGIGREPPRLRPTRRRHHRTGAGQPGHPDPGDVGRRDAHRDRFRWSRWRTRLRPGRDGDPAAGRLGACSIRRFGRWAG